MGTSPAGVVDRNVRPTGASWRGSDLSLEFLGVFHLLIITVSTNQIQKSYLNEIIPLLTPAVLDSFII